MDKDLVRIAEIIVMEARKKPKVMEIAFRENPEYRKLLKIAERILELEKENS